MFGKETVFFVIETILLRDSGLCPSYYGSVLLELVVFLNLFLCRLFYNLIFSSLQILKSIHINFVRLETIVGWKYFLFRVYSHVMNTIITSRYLNICIFLLAVLICLPISSVLWTICNLVPQLQWQILLYH